MVVSQNFGVTNQQLRAHCFGKHGRIPRLRTFATTHTWLDAAGFSVVQGLVPALVVSCATYTVPEAQTPAAPARFKHRK